MQNNTNNTESHIFKIKGMTDSNLTFLKNDFDLDYDFERIECDRAFETLIRLSNLILTFVRPIVTHKKENESEKRIWVEKVVCLMRFENGIKRKYQTNKRYLKCGIQKRFQTM